MPLAAAAQHPQGGAHPGRARHRRGGSLARRPRQGPGGRRRPPAQAFGGVLGLQRRARGPEHVGALGLPHRAVRVGLVPARSRQRVHLAPVAAPAVLLLDLGGLPRLQRQPVLLGLLPEGPQGDDSAAEVLAVPQVQVVVIFSHAEDVDHEQHWLVVHEVLVHVVLVPVEQRLEGVLPDGVLRALRRPGAVELAHLAADHDNAHDALRAGVHRRQRQVFSLVDLHCQRPDSRVPHQAPHQRPRGRVGPRRALVDAHDLDRDSGPLHLQASARLDLAPAQLQLERRRGPGAAHRREVQVRASQKVVGTLQAA
mmetsp:Transcript_3901/g.10755  ORF Transcript_3901/g.10755 Transcript_3901/m.10755 type:complete len:311 (+) Transcript_3901:1501-2433(+)